jgi:hypothetical protein
MPYNRETNKPVTIYPSLELYEKISKDAKNQDRSVKYIIEKILKEYYENKEST